MIFLIDFSFVMKKKFFCIHFQKKHIFPKIKGLSFVNHKQKIIHFYVLLPILRSLL